MGDRCTGHCCEAFIIGSPEQVKRRYDAAMSVPVNMRRRDDHETIQIYEMVEYLGQFTFNPVHPVTDITDYYERTGQSQFKKNDPRFRDMGHFHRCKNFDKVSRNCTIYETRPAMCSGYPDGRACTFVGCGSDEAKRAGTPPTKLVPLDNVRNSATRISWFLNRPIEPDRCRVIDSDEEFDEEPYAWPPRLRLRDNYLLDGPSVYASSSAIIGTPSVK